MCLKTIFQPVKAVVTYLEPNMRKLSFKIDNRKQFAYIYLQQELLDWNQMTRGAIPIELQNEVIEILKGPGDRNM